MKTSSARTADLGTTIFAEMSARAVSTGAVNLGQGFPDTDGPEAVVEAAVDALRGGRNQYAPGIGVPELRQAVADHQKRFYGLDVDPETEVAASTGATEAIAAAILGLVDPGDEVIALEPYYDSYVAVIQMAGGVRRPVTLRAPDFRLPVDELRAAVSPRTTAILLNSPHNPTGTVLRRDELEAIAELAIEHDLVVITDEVYEHLTFDGIPHIPIATLPGMAERTLTISSGGKSFSLTGWKIGWASGPAELVQAMTQASDGNRSAQPALEPDGDVTVHHVAINVERDGLPTMDEIVLPARHHGHVLGRFLITASTNVVHPSREQRQVAVLLANQVGAGLAANPPRRDDAGFAH
jgi:N-succinyldiaminopimelate aminotransferase